MIPTVKLANTVIRVLGLMIAAGLPAFYSASSVNSDSGQYPAPKFSGIVAVPGPSISDREPGVEYENPQFQSLLSGRRLIQYIKKKDGKEMGRYLRQSFGGSDSYSPEERIEDIPGITEGLGPPGIHLLERGTAAISTDGSNVKLSYRTDQERSWGPFTRVNDELASVAGSVSVHQGPDGTLYCVWLDSRKGFQLTFFSSSPDGGRTWTPNRPVEYDFREGDQWNPQMVIGAGGRLLVFWEDWRDRKTLVDIRYAWSDDAGKHWVAGGKINDDSAHVWQIDFGAVASGNEIYVAFSDFRDPGEEGDNDWNIYFARSGNNGTSFEPNVRLNDVLPGIDKDPCLSVSSTGELFCVWRTGRNTIFGQVAASYSPDGGRHWSPSTVIGGDHLSEMGGPNVVPFGEGKMLVNWRTRYYDGSEPDERILSVGEGSPDVEGDPGPEPLPKPVNARKGDPIFTDDFESDSGWNEFEGLWLNVNGTYMGTAPGKTNHFVSFAPVEEPESYVLEGRFLFDPVAHYVSSIYLRSGNRERRQIAVANQFRVGSWISFTDGNEPGWLSPMGGRPVAEKRYPFVQNKWYEFRLVVTPKQIDYYIGGRRMLSAVIDGEFEPGSIGLAGFTSAPTYFDDIRIYAIKP